ncbi:MAG TPA: hypothetical protein VGA62_11330 [Acidimicrobiia bacterium]
MLFSWEDRVPKSAYPTEAGEIDDARMVDGLDQCQEVEERRRTLGLESLVLIPGSRCPLALSVRRRLSVF